LRAPSNACNAERDSVRRTDVVTAAILVVLGMCAIGVLIPRYVDDASAGAALSPRFMPYVAALLATAAALGLLVGALLRRNDGLRSSLDGASLRFFGSSIAALGGAYVLMSLLGYFVGGAAFVAGTLFVARAKPMTIVVAATATPTVLWLTFARLLATPLP
jgi:hypothetical protein